MLIGSNGKSLGLSARIVEPEINREGSNYIISHYNDLLKYIMSASLKEEKASDLLHDVYVSLVSAENEGNGFDMEYGDRLSDSDDSSINIMDVAQFVYGRIKLYAKNSKYRTDIVESNSGQVYETNVYYTPELDKDGQEILDRNGKPKMSKRVERKKSMVPITSSAASFNETNDAVDNNDEFQTAFAKASVSDSTDDIAEYMSLREQIDFCIDICDNYNIQIINLFKNIDLMASMLGDFSKRKKTSETVFAKLTEVVNYHDEFADTLMSLLRFSSTHKAAFESIIATY
jgi:hypothetical protein